MGKIKLKDRLSRWLRPSGSGTSRKALSTVDGVSEAPPSSVTYVTDSAETLSSPAAAGTKFEEAGPRPGSTRASRGSSNLATLLDSTWQDQQERLAAAIQGQPAAQPAQGPQAGHTPLPTQREPEPEAAFQRQASELAPAASATSAEAANLGLRRSGESLAGQEDTVQPHQQSLINSTGQASSSGRAEPPPRHSDSGPQQQQIQQQQQQQQQQPHLAAHEGRLMLPVAQEQHETSAGPGRPPPTQTSGGSSVSTNLGVGFGQHLTTGKSANSMLPHPDADAELEGVVDELREGSVEARSAAAEKLFNMCAEDEGARQRTGSLGVVQPLVRLLYDGKERGRMYAAYALSSIMSPTSSLMDMRAAGAIPALISVLNTSKVLASKKGAMRALGRLARSDEAAAEVVAAGGLPPIIALLDCHDAGLVRRCLVALYFIGADKEMLQGEIMRAGAVSAAVRLCSSSHPEVQAEAADVLKVLTRNNKAAMVMVDAGGLDALTFVAAEGTSDRARASACKAIQRLAATPGTEHAVRRSKAARFLTTEESSDGGEAAVLADVVTRGAPQERQQAALVIMEGAAGNDPTVSRELAGAGVVEALIGMLRTGNAQGQIYASQALCNMAGDFQVRERIIAAGGVQELMWVLNQGSTPALAAAAALERLVTTPSGAKTAIQADAVASLVHLLKGGRPEAQLSAANSLRLLAQHLRTATGSNLLLLSGALPTLVRVCSRSEQQVRLASLTVLRELAHQDALQTALVAEGAVALLAALQHSAAPEVRSLATGTLETVAASSPAAWQSVAQERGVQDCVSRLIAGIHATVAVNPQLEEALRLIPRSLFLPAEAREQAWSCGSVLIATAGIVLGDMRAEGLSMQALAPEEGHLFLDVGSGCGFLTMLAGHLVGDTGRAVGVEVWQPAMQYATDRQAAVQQQRGLSSLSCTFVHGSCFDPTVMAALGRFDRIHVGGSCPKPRLRDLLKLLKPGGKMTVPCEGQLLLLLRPMDGGPVPEPIVLGQVPPLDVLMEAEGVQLQLPMSPGNLLPPLDANGSVVLSTPERAYTSPRSMGGSTASPTQAQARPDNNMGQAPWTQVSSVTEIPNMSSNLLNGGGRNMLSPSSRLPRSPGMPAHKMERIASGSNNHTASGGPGSGPGSPRGRPTAGQPRPSLEDQFDASEEQSWFVRRDDISICRNAEGKKCRLGEGGFGVVYKALMNGCDEVAVKLVKADKPSPKDMILFHKEVRILRKLHHRNIVQFYGACLEPGSMFFVTELMKGGDLYSALRNHPETMRWDRLGRKVAMDVALGINYLHTRRPPMMHRDLKSPNVLLSEEGVAKIADVGMVRSQVKELVTEVIRHERASIKADMWSYGILVWELITGLDITEFQPLAIAQAMQLNGSSDGSSSTLQLPAVCPPIAARLFLECTRSEPELRPTAMQIVEWLRNAQ